MGANRGRDKFQKYKPFLLFMTGCCSKLPFTIRKKWFEHYRMTKGTKGIVLRYILLKSIAKQCGENVSIHPGVYLFSAENLSIGNNVSIHPMCYIDATGEIEIGNDVSIAHSVSVMSTSHRYEEPHIPIKDQGTQRKKVIISDNVWVGAKVTILYGTAISSGCIIASNAVVNKNVPENTVVGGVPAKLIKKR